MQYVKYLLKYGVNVNNVDVNSQQIVKFFDNSQLRVKFLQYYFPLRLEGEGTGPCDHS